MAIGDEDEDVLSAARRRRQNYTLPAVSQMANQRNTAFARNAPVNTPQQNFADQIPIGGFGLGLGYGSTQMNFSDFLNPTPQSFGQTQQSSGPLHFLPPGFTSTTGSTGIPGSNPNDLHFLPPGFTSTTNASGQLKFLPPGFTAIGGNTGGQVSDQSLAPIQYTLPGVNADVRALSDLSVGALQGAKRYTSGGIPSQTTAGGGLLPGIKAGYRVTESPTGQGTMIAGPARKPNSLPPKPNRLSGDYTGQTWQLGNWY